MHGVEIDTAYFSGNHAPAVSVEGCYEPDGSYDDNDSTSSSSSSSAARKRADERVIDPAYDGWKPVLTRRACGPSRRHAWRVDGAGAGVGVGAGPITHARLRMYPDGGIARWRLYGAAEPVWPTTTTTTAAAAVVELSATRMGGLAVACSDEHFGRVQNLLLPGRGTDMGDGWETRRSRAAGHVDWVVVRLGARGWVGRLVVDTMHFRGNFPRAVRVEGCDVPQGKGWEEAQWVQIVAEREMSADEEAVVEIEERVLTHLRLVIIPDGGVKRFRAFGRRA